MIESQHFAEANAAANGSARALIAAGVPADDIADAFITKALAAWAAATDRHSAARELLRVWTDLRDGR